MLEKLIQYLFHTSLGYFTLFIFAIITAYSFKYRNNERTPTIVTTFGILGTFVGITFGLLSFNEDAIEESIPLLLGGLQTAFLTSIAGIIAAIILKTWRMHKESTDEREVTNATADDIANLIKKGNEISNNRLEKIEQSLVGDKENTIIYNISRLRTNIMDNHHNMVEVQQELFNELLIKQDELKQKFDEFKEEVAEQNTDALIEALNNVMKDFNTRLNEYLGDNFIRLNEGVEKMLTWQDNYKNQIQTTTQNLKAMLNQFEKHTDQLELIEKSINNISDDSAAIIRVSEELEPILSELQEKQENLKRTMEQFSGIADRAQDAFPAIEKRLENLVGEFSSTVERTLRESETILSSQRSSFESIIQNIEQFDKEAKTNIKLVLDETREMNRRLTEENNEIIRDRIEQLDSVLEQELKKSLDSLGSQLVSLSQKFVKDYQPLTDRLRKIVEISKDIDEV